MEEIPLDAVIQPGGWRGQTNVRAPSLALSPAGMSSADPEKSCSVMGEGAEEVSCLNRRVQQLLLLLPLAYLVRLGCLVWIIPYRWMPACKLF